MKTALLPARRRLEPARNFFSRSCLHVCSHGHVNAPESNDPASATVLPAGIDPRRELAGKSMFVSGAGDQPCWELHVPCCVT
jgi:hypothetical protein